MRKTTVMASALTVALLAVSVTAASAKDKVKNKDRDDHGPGPVVEVVRDADRDDYRGPGPVIGFAGDVLAGAFKIVTLPLELLADVGRDGWHGPPVHQDRREEREGAYAVTPEAARDYYGAGARYYGPPPRLYALDER